MLKAAFVHTFHPRTSPDALCLRRQPALKAFKWLKNKYFVKFRLCAATRSNLLKAPNRVWYSAHITAGTREANVAVRKELRPDVESCNWHHCRANSHELVPRPSPVCRAVVPVLPLTLSVNTKWWRKTQKEGNPPALLWTSVKISGICYILCFPRGGTHTGSEITPLTATSVCTAIKQVNA